MSDTEVRIECGINSSDGIVRLRVSDGPSSEVLASVRFDAGEFLRLIAGTIATCPAWQTDHPERIGLTMQNDRWVVPQGVADGDDWEAASIAWAMSRPDAVEWETFKASRHNFGRAVAVRRWVTR